MPTYAAETVATKEYIPNAVIRFGGQYFAVREPDSGLDLKDPFAGAVDDLKLNAVTINPKTVNTPIPSTGFSLLDKNGIVGRLLKDTAAEQVKSDVEVWLGRSGVGMAFADYFQLPTARLSKVQKKGDVFSFTTLDPTEKLNQPLYQTTAIMDGEIVAGTSIIRASTSIDDFPSSGYFRIGTEIIYYGSKDDDLKYFYDCARGAFNTTPAAHDHAETIQHAEVVTGNPLDILLWLMISNGGGGTYDVLADGLGMDPATIDVAAFEALSDDADFSGTTFELAFYSLASALKTLEAEVLTPCKLRLVAKDGVLSIVELDAEAFAGGSAVIDNDAIVGEPTADIDSTSIQNRIEVSWDYSEDTSKFATKEEFGESDSITDYGLSASPLKFQFKGITDRDFIADFATAMLARLAFPTPVFTVKTHMSKSLVNVGDKVRLVTNRLTNWLGEANFDDTVEVISRSINWVTGEVTFKLAYTSFTGRNPAYIAPSDDVVTVNSQSSFDVASGRGTFWAAGWRVRLWDRDALVYLSDENEILSISGDTIVFAQAWSTTLDETKHTLSFPEYALASASQKRFEFVSIDDADFTRVEKAYTIAS